MTPTVRSYWPNPARAYFSTRCGPRARPSSARSAKPSRLWILKLALDAARTDDLEEFRAAVMDLDLPVGSVLNGWGVKFEESGQNSNARVQHYMLQWQNGSLVTVWPEEFTTNRAMWMPLGPWDQRK